MQRRRWFSISGQQLRRRGTSSDPTSLGAASSSSRDLHQHPALLGAGNHTAGQTWIGRRGRLARTTDEECHSHAIIHASRSEQNKAAVQVLPYLYASGRCALHPLPCALQVYQQAARATQSCGCPQHSRHASPEHCRAFWQRSYWLERFMQASSQVGGQSH
jgi:hypothetical protein